MKILFVDDATIAIKPLCDALDWEGHRVLVTSNIADACERLYLPNFSLIILDRFMPFDSGGGLVMDVDAGYRMFQRIRSFPEYKRIPIIVFTNWLPTEPEAWTSKGSPLKFICKSTPPSDFVRIMKQWMSTLVFTPSPFIERTDEHPNVAPYFVTSNVTGERVSVVFRPCECADKADVESVVALEKWAFGEDFERLFRDEDGACRLLKLVPKNNYRHVLGLYWHRNFDESVPFYEDIVFETSPHLTWKVPKRAYSEIGLVLIGRVLTEYLIRAGAYEAFKASGTISITDGGIKVGSPQPGPDFLEMLGFKRNTDTGLFEISNEKARSILKRVRFPIVPASYRDDS
jgi:CheY-like chemotaxis protein